MQLVEDMGSFFFLDGPLPEDKRLVFMVRGTIHRGLSVMVVAWIHGWDRVGASVRVVVVVDTSCVARI